MASDRVPASFASAGRRILAASCVVVAVGVIAQPSKGQDVTASPYVGYISFADGPWTEYWQNEAVRSGPLVGGRAGIDLASAWTVELSYAFAPLRIRETTLAFQCLTDPCDAPLVDLFESLRVHIYEVGLRYRLPLELPLRPHASLGAGGIVLDRGDGPTISDFVVSPGVGANIPLGQAVELRFEARDHVQLCSAAGEPIAANDTRSACPAANALLHHIEVSWGIQFGVRTP